MVIAASSLTYTAVQPTGTWSHYSPKTWEFASKQVKITVVTIFFPSQAFISCATTAKQRSEFGSTFPAQPLLEPAKFPSSPTNTSLFHSQVQSQELQKEPSGWAAGVAAPFPSEGERQHLFKPTELKTSFLPSLATLETSSLYLNLAPAPAAFPALLSSCSHCCNPRPVCT